MGLSSAWSRRVKTVLAEQKTPGAYENRGGERAATVRPGGGGVAPGCSAR